MILLENQPLRNSSHYGIGGISKKSLSSYAVTKNKKYYCSCRTYEQAYYVRQELNKCDWDKKELPRIFEEYPVYYTDLLEFYRYVGHNKSLTYKWSVNIPPRKSDNGTLQQIRCSNIEDALFERDFLTSHNWDYELLVEIIDDNENTYYDYELPPYPERKIRNIRITEPHINELTRLNQILKDNPNISQMEACHLLGIADMTLRNWLKNYNTNWNDYKELVADGVNPLTVLKLNRHIYKPDLSPNIPNFKGYIYKSKSKTNPYRIEKKHIRYGSYPTHKIAEKVVEELARCNWDKKELPRIQKKFGVTPYFDKKYVYEKKRKSGSRYCIRKKINGKPTHFGTYDNYELASIVRDYLVSNGWDVDSLDKTVNKCKEYYTHKNNFKNNMFNGKGVQV